MANQGGTHEQHVKAGKMSHKGSEDTKTAAAAAKTSDTKKAAGTKADDTKTTGKQGGSHEQQSKAGQQSHKNKH